MQHLSTDSSAIARRQQGFTLLELMVAITVGLFLLGALLTVQQTNRLAFVSQNQLAQLQDNQRMAMSILADVVQSAGYFPDPTINVAATTFAAAAGPPVFAASQSISGTYNAAAPGDTLAVRFATASGDGVINCSGLANTSGALAVYVNTFSVVGTAPNRQLVCTMNGTQYTLISGVNNFSVVYGVKTNPAAVGNNVSTYLNATQMTAANWQNVVSVMVQLTFNNPLYVVGQGQPQFLQLQRVIGVMNKLGPVT
jgi:type IV pilus assembly protein PilW